MGSQRRSLLFFLKPTLTRGCIHATVSCVETPFLVEVPALLEVVALWVKDDSPNRAPLEVLIRSLPCQCQVCRYQRAHGREVQEDELPF